MWEPVFRFREFMLTEPARKWNDRFREILMPESYYLYINNKITCVDIFSTRLLMFIQLVQKHACAY